MVLTSYNQYTNQNNMYQSRAENSTGYKMSDDSGTKWSYNSSTSSKYLTQGDTLYRISSTNNAYAYWVSSPSAYSTEYVMRVDSYGYVGYTYYATTDYGFRPVVCLKSGISLKEVESGEFYQI